MKKTDKPVRLDFSDDAKRRAGIEPSDFGKQVALLKAAHANELGGLRGRIQSLESLASTALKALEEGRRGDALKALRAAAPPPAAGAASHDDGGNKLA